MAMNPPSSFYEDDLSFFLGSRPVDSQSALFGFAFENKIAFYSAFS